MRQLSWAECKHLRKYVMPVGLVFSVCLCICASVCVCMCMCVSVYVCLYIILYKACFWDCLLLPRRVQLALQLWNVSSTANSYKFMAGSTHATRTRPAHCATPPFLPATSLSSPLLLLPVVLLVLLPRSPLVIQLKCKKILTLRAPANGACALLLVLAVSMCVCMLCVYPVVAARGVSAICLKN